MNGTPPCCIACSKGAIDLKTFEIIHNQQVVGKATVTVEGLYYQISCCCKMPDKSIYRIYARTDKETKDLGVCIPSGDSFVLAKKIPIKQICIENSSFQICEMNSQHDSQAVPVYNDKPFLYIDKLERARFEVRNDQPYIIIK